MTKVPAVPEAPAHGATPLPFGTLTFPADSSSETALLGGTLLPSDGCLQVRSESGDPDDDDVVALILPDSAEWDGVGLRLGDHRYKVGDHITLGGAYGIDRAVSEQTYGLPASCPDVVVFRGR